MLICLVRLLQGQHLNTDSTAEQQVVQAGRPASRLALMLCRGCSGVCLVAHG